MRHILITGASSGIGEALAEVYSAPGQQLLLVARNRDRLQRVAESCRSKGAEVVAQSVDILHAQDLAHAVKAFDDSHPLDLVVANAGVATGTQFGRPFEIPEAGRRVVETNVIGAMNTVTPILPRLTARAKGHLVFVGSLAGLRGLPQSPSYCASKSAIHVYAQALRAALRGTGVNVSLVLPGFVKTPMNQASRFPKPFEMNATQAARIIKRGIDRKQNLIAFPLLLYVGVQLMRLLPGSVADYFISRVDVDVDTVE